MSRGNTAANTTASQAGTIRPLVFVEIQFDGGTVYVHNGVGPYQWTTPVASPPETWEGVGALGQLGEIEETAELTPYRITLTLQGVDSTILSEVDDEELYERLVIVYLGYIGDDGALVADPDERWRGYMDSAQVSGTSITITVETELALFRRSNGKLFTDEDQQEAYSGDTGFQYLDQLIDLELRWGPDGHQVDLYRLSPGASGIDPNVRYDNRRNYPSR